MVGLLDFFTKEQIDPDNGSVLPCFDTINTEVYPDSNNAIKCVYDLKPQSAEHECNVTFIDCVDGGVLKLLSKKEDKDFNMDDFEDSKNLLPYVQTNFLIDEVANIQLLQTDNGKTKVKQLVRKVGKDRFSALKYSLWFAKTFENHMESEQDEYEQLEAYFDF